MELKALRRRCEARLRELDLPTPFDVHGFCERVARRRDRPIILRPIATQVGPWGLWAAGEHTDYILYESSTSSLHQEHIILHELSHLICGHRPARVTEPAVAAALFADLSPDTIQRMLSRATYSAAEEQEAEVLASVLLERVSVSRRGQSHAELTLPTDDVEVLGRLAKTLRVDAEERQ